MEAEAEEQDRAFRAALRAQAVTDRKEKWPSTVTEGCADNDCTCERTDKVLSGPTKPPKKRRLTKTVTFNGVTYNYRLTLKRAYHVVEGLCVANDDDAAVEDVSFFPDEYEQRCV